MFCKGTSKVLLTVRINTYIHSGATENPGFSNSLDSRIFKGWVIVRETDRRTTSRNTLSGLMSVCFFKIL